MPSSPLIHARYVIVAAKAQDAPATSEMAMKEIKAIVRTDRVQAVVKSIEEGGAVRILISHVHSLGAGVDPEDYRVSFEEGAAYTEKSKVEVVCRDESVEGIIAALSSAARTGHPGDGIIVITDLERVVQVRTGDEGIMALA